MVLLLIKRSKVLSQTIMVYDHEKVQKFVENYHVLTHLWPPGPTPLVSAANYFTQRGQAICPWPGPAQLIYKPNLVCNPIGEFLHQTPLFLLVDTGLGL